MVRFHKNQDGDHESIWFSVLILMHSNNLGTKVLVVPGNIFTSCFRSPTSGSPSLSRPWRNWCPMHRMFRIMSPTLCQLACQATWTKPHKSLLSEWLHCVWTLFSSGLRACTPYPQTPFLEGNLPSKNLFLDVLLQWNVNCVDMLVLLIFTYDFGCNDLRAGGQCSISDPSHPHVCDVQWSVIARTSSPWSFTEAAEQLCRGWVYQWRWGSIDSPESGPSCSKGIWIPCQSKINAPRMCFISVPHPKKYIILIIQPQNQFFQSNRITHFDKTNL